MFFQSCCACDESEPIIVDPSPTQLNNAPLSPTLLLHANYNWPTIVILMRLKEVALLKFWCSARINEEAEQEGIPSFELLSVALWLNEEDFLNTLTVDHHGDLAEYIASRNDEIDSLGYSLWNYAKQGQGLAFIHNAMHRNLIPQNTSIHKTNSIILQPSILELHKALYTGNLTEILTCLEKATTVNKNKTFSALAESGCWQGLLICIVLGSFNPIQHDIFTTFAKYNNNEFGVKVAQAWGQLKDAPRSEGIRDERSMQDLLEAGSGEEHASFTITYKKTLQQLLIDPEYVELCLAYLIFRFMQKDSVALFEGKLIRSNNKAFYATCINELLTNCWHKPQIAALELLCYSPPAVISILKPDIRAALLPQLQKFYPNAAAYVCPPDKLPTDREYSHPSLV